MTTCYNSTQAVFRKLKDEYLHALLVTKPLTDYTTEAEEEVYIERWQDIRHTAFVNGCIEMAITICTGNCI